jgi:DNA-binding response OmpR family regulator
MAITTGPPGGARILLVEDDATLGGGLRQALQAQRYQAVWVTSGAAALELGRRERFDLVLLDLMLPDLDGVEVCRRLRTARPELTIVMLTARREEIDVVVGLDAGADDYLLKPFRLGELLARVRAHLRRQTHRQEQAPDRAERLAAGGVELDRAARRAWLHGVELDLRPKEFDLLALLLAEAGRAVPRERIMTEVWDEHWFGSTKTLDMHVAALRRKLGDQAARITTLRGVGYRLEPH